MSKRKDNKIDTFTMLDNLHEIRAIENKFLEGDISIEEFGESLKSLISIAFQGPHTVISILHNYLRLKLEINPKIGHAKLDPILETWMLTFKASKSVWNRLFEQMREILGDLTNLELLDFLITRKLRMRVKSEPIVISGLLKPDILYRNRSVHSRLANMKMKNKIQDDEPMPSFEAINYGAF